MNITPQIEEFIETYTRALKDNTAAIFAGAGLSQAAGFVNWKALLSGIARDLRLNVDKEEDLVAVAQYHYNENRSRHKINQLLVDEFSNKARLTSNHEILARLPISTYWTTNYDQLIERALRDAGKTPDVKITSSNLTTNLGKRDALVYKMHGDVSDPGNAVVTKDDYENYNKNRQIFSTALQGDLVTKTFLFLGFSFDDPNIYYILSRIRVLLGENQRDHYCFMRRVQRRDPGNKGKAYTYAKVKQELQIKDLRRYAIKALLFDDYSEFTKILQLVENRFRRTKIFISGSADEFGSWGKEKSIAFLHKLSKTLSSNEYPVITGFGLGVGSAVINGVLDHIYSTNYRHIDDYLKLRPFPQYATGGKDLHKLWQDYREEMISQAGIALFVFGNKLKDGKIVKADGMIKEFDIAVKQGVKVIPVGLTGYVSEELWSKVLRNQGLYISKNKKVHALFKKLNNKNTSSDRVIKIITDLIKLLQREH